jgi:hypothetical protein
MDQPVAMKQGEDALLKLVPRENRAGRRLDLHRNLTGPAAAGFQVDPNGDVPETPASAE